MSMNEARRSTKALIGPLLVAAAPLLAMAGCDSDDPVGPNPPLDGPRGELVATIPIPPDYGIHDMHVRDGLVFVSAWNTGVIIYDIGGVGSGTPESPVELSRFVPSGGNISGRIHNAWWFHNPNTDERRYLFLGQEGPGVVGNQASGDIFALDVTDPTAPVQVGRYTLENAGAHNFWMDEPAEILYAAYYNGGVVALDVSGTLPADLTEREIDRIEPAGGDSYVWGVQLHQGSLYASDMVNGFFQLRLEEGTFQVLAGGGNVPDRFTSDLALRGSHAYTGTWGNRGGRVGNAVKIWALDAEGAPTLADSVIIADIGTVSDVEVSPDGSLLAVSTEGGPGAGLQLYSLEDPLSPTLLWRETISTGVHTITFGEVGGRSYVFGAKNPHSPALLIYDIAELVP